VSGAPSELMDISETIGEFCRGLGSFRDFSKGQLSEIKH
jgi:hypothetical protein